MKPNEIHAALILNGCRPSKIAKICGVTRSQISHVIYSRSKSPAIRAQIAKVIGKSVEEIWPEMAA